MELECKGFALVIGIGDYDGRARLSWAKNDALQMMERLEQCRYRVSLLLNPSAILIRSRLEELKHNLEKKEYRNVVLYYAGHVFSYEQAHFMVLPTFPVGSTLMELADLIVPHTYKVETMIQEVCSATPQAGKDRAIVVILDTCHSFFHLGMVDALYSPAGVDQCLQNFKIVLIIL